MHVITLIYSNKTYAEYEVKSSNLSQALEAIDEQVKNQNEKIVKIAQVVIDGTPLRRR